MARRRQDNSPDLAKTTQFFVRQLRGEEPLSFETARKLYLLALDILELRPWDILDEENFVLLRDPASNETCTCTILGALGILFAVQVYVGDQNHHLLRKMVAGDVENHADVYAAMKGVSVEFVPTDQLTAPDREVNNALKGTGSRLELVPVFRAYRPGYHPWYLTEDEGKLLVLCLKCVLALCAEAGESGEMTDYWDEEETYPFLSSSPSEGTANFAVTVDLVRAPDPTPPQPAAAPVDPARAEDILRRQFQRKGAVEVGHFFTLGAIGKRDERKACVRATAVCDVSTGFAYSGNVGMPEDGTGELLVRALLDAMKEGRFIPREIRVRNEEFKWMLADVADKFGSTVVVKKSLPFLEEFERGLRSLTGDRGNPGF